MTVEEMLATPDPLVRVVRGKPTPEELVALVTGLMMLQDDGPSARLRPAQAQSGWADRAALLQARPFRPAPGNWSRSSSR